MEAIADWFIGNWRRILSWFKDDIFRRLFVNAGKLLSANAIAAVLGLVTAVLTARALGPENYGILALVLVYQLTIGKLVTFNAWQAIIKFGSEALEENDERGLRQLIKFGFCLDIGSAVVGTILGMALAGSLISLLGWNQSVGPLLLLYSVLILFSLSGTPVGILRLFDRFDLLSYTAILSASIRLVGVLCCVIYRQGLFGFVLVYLMTGIVGQVYQLAACLWVLRRQGIRGILTASLHGTTRRFPFLFEYVWTGYVDATVRSLSREGDELVIAGFTTPAALGVFKIVKQFARVLPTVSDPLYQSIYPELSRLWTQGDKRSLFSLIKRTTALVGVFAIGMWVLFIVFGRHLIIMTVGSEYMPAYPVTIVYILAMGIALVTFSFAPLALSAGKPRIPLKSDVIATVVYFSLIVPLLLRTGIMGAAIAYVFYYLGWSMTMLRSLRSAL